MIFGQLGNDTVQGDGRSRARSTAAPSRLGRSASRRHDRSDADVTAAERDSILTRPSSGRPTATTTSRATAATTSSSATSARTTSSATTPVCSRLDTDDAASPAGADIIFGGAGTRHRPQRYRRRDDRRRRHRHDDTTATRATPTRSSATTPISTGWSASTVPSATGVDTANGGFLEFNYDNVRGGAARSSRAPSSCSTTRRAARTSTRPARRRLRRSRRDPRRVRRRLRLRHDRATTSCSATAGRRPDRRLRQRLVLRRHRPGRRDRR